MPGQVGKIPSPAGTAEKKRFSGVPAGLVVIPSNPGVQTPGYFQNVPLGHSVSVAQKLRCVRTNHSEVRSPKSRPEKIRRSKSGMIDRPGSVWIRVSEFELLLAALSRRRSGSDFGFEMRALPPAVRAKPGGRSLTLSPERGCVPQSGTSRSRFARLACWNTPDAAKLFKVLRLALCTQPRSNLVAFGGQWPDAPRVTGVTCHAPHSTANSFCSFIFRR